MIKLRPEIISHLSLCSGYNTVIKSFDFCIPDILYKVGLMIKKGEINVWEHVEFISYGFLPNEGSTHCSLSPVKTEDFHWILIIRKKGIIWVNVWCRKFNRYFHSGSQKLDISEHNLVLKQDSSGSPNFL